VITKLQRLCLGGGGIADARTCIMGFRAGLVEIFCYAAIR
jgi:hypothetical protein